MRVALAILAYLCVTACSATAPAPTAGNALARNDEWRQKQAELDAQAIVQGMTQARARAEFLARSAR